MRLGRRMLFLDSKVLRHPVDANGRIKLLRELEARDRKALILSLRTRCFDELLGGAERTAEMETTIADWTESNMDEPYVVGDVFPFQDYLLYLTFDADASAPG